MAEKLLPKIDQFQFEKLSFGDFMSKCTSEVDVQINTQMNLDIFSSQRGLGECISYKDSTLTPILELVDHPT